MDPIVNAVILGVFMAVGGGPAMAWLMKSEKYRSDHADRKAKFAAGQGRDPDRSIVGPHKPFALNAIVVAVIFFVVGSLVAALVASFTAGTLT